MEREEEFRKETIHEIKMMKLNIKLLQIIVGALFIVIILISISNLF